MSGTKPTNPSKRDSETALREPGKSLGGRPQPRASGGRPQPRAPGDTKQTARSGWDESHNAVLTTGARPPDGGRTTVAGVSRTRPSGPKRNLAADVSAARAPKPAATGPSGPKRNLAADVSAARAPKPAATKPKPAATKPKPRERFSDDLKALAAKERADIAAQRAAKPKPAATPKPGNKGYSSYKKLMG
jgi:hypothetical protein